MLKFSIIVPVYNAEKYLKECVNSIKIQSYPDYEVILTDDGSTDRSGAMCDAYVQSDDRFSVIHKANEGVSAARNDGIRMARGEYLLLLDSDDFLADDKALEKIAAVTGQTDVVTFAARVYRNKKFCERPFDLSPWSFASLSGAEFLERVLQGQQLYQWMPWQYAFRRDWWDANEFCFQKGVVYEDVESIWRFLLAAGSVYVLDEDIYAYRINDSSITHNVNRKLLEDFLYVIEKNIRAIQADGNIADALKCELNNNFAFSFFTVVSKMSFVKDKQERAAVYRMLDQKKWICDYAVHGRHRLPSQLVKRLGLWPVAHLFSLRWKLQHLLSKQA